MTGFAALGWLMRRYGYPVAAMVVGLLLGGMAEGEMLRTYQLVGNDPTRLLERPLFLAILAVFVVSVLIPLIRQHWPGQATTPALR
jgi:putative tricarboxylic transport membrane protein